MQRIEIGGPLGDGPEMKPLQQNKYWAAGGWNRVDLREKLAADAIDPVEVIESCKPWQALKMPIVCKFCEKNKAGQPYLDQVHWCFQHCLQCEGFYICIACVSTVAFEKMKKDHKGHKFIQITTRPLSAPIYDGSDLEQLELFRNSQTSQQFFTYFPWFFHCFAGMDQVRQFNRTQTIAALELSPTRGSLEWLTLMEMQSYPVDWYLRTFGRGDWQSLLNSMGPLLDARIQSAQASIQLNDLLLKLQRYQAEKEAFYGPGDIPSLREAEVWRALAANLAPSMVNYTIYTIPLQFMTVLDPYINQAKLERLLVDPSREVPPPASPDHAQNPGGEGSTKNLPGKFRKLRLGKKSSSIDSTEQSTDDELPPDIIRLGPDTALDPYREMTRLWPVFSVIFKDHPGYSDLVSPVMMSDLSSYFERMKSSWNSFLSRDHLIREKLWEMDYKNLPKMTKDNLATLDSATDNLWPSTHPKHEDLQQAQKLRVRGNFNEAIEILRPLHDTDPSEAHIALQLQRVYLEQGYLQKSMGCSTGVAKMELVDPHVRLPQAQTEASGISPRKDVRQAGPIARALLLMISNYLRCSVHGRWEAALTEAAELFDTYLIDWNSEKENVSLLVHLEVYYHKIVLETSRDLEKDIPKDAALARLKAIRKHICDTPPTKGLAPLAWDILLTELEMLKRPVRDQYFDVEDAFSVAKYLHTATIALPMINKFLSSHIMTDARSHAPEVLAASLMLEAETGRDNGQAAAVTSMTSIAATIYADLNSQPGLPSHAGLLDVEMFEIKVGGRSVPFARVEALYAKLRERNDLTRMRVLRRYNVNLGSQDSPAYNWELFQRAGLRELAKEAGDNLMYQRWNLRKYAGDSLSVASILDAERVIANDETVAIHSSLLVVLASFNLSRAYMSVGNFFEAALNSLLHVSLTAQRQDVESHQRAILNVLHVFSEAVSNNTVNPDETLKQLAILWTGWLTPKSYGRWKASQARCDEIDRFIDAALFIPNLAGRVGRENQRANEMVPKPYPTSLIDYMITHLRLAFALYEALPTYLSHIVLPKLSFAIGAVATYICNKELAIRAYSVGQSTTHSQDKPNLAMFRLKVGKLMTLLGEEDPEHWMHVVPAGRALLSSAADKFLAHRAMAGAQMRVCEANVALLRSLVAEARARKLMLAERWKSLGGTIDDLDALVVQEIVAVVNLQEETMLPMTMTDIMILKIAQRLVMASPYEASQNLAFLASSPIPRQNRELVIEFCYILSDLEPFQKKPPGTALTTFIQRYKANVLYRQSFSNLVPARYLKVIEADPTALKLYHEEQRLIKEGPQAMGDHRLEELGRVMMDHQTLKPLLDHRQRTMRVVPEDFHSLASIARLTQEPTSNLILIDWMKYHDYFMITGYNVTKQEICILELIPDYKVVDVEKWVEQHLNVDGKHLPTTLSSSDIFKDLYPLVRAIAGSCTKEDLLVFSPSQELHSIPLHALPYSDANDRPVIDFHSIVYTPSNIILKECILRVIEEESCPPVTASLFGRWGAGDAKGAKEEESIKASLEDVSSQVSQIDVKSTIISGTSLTHSAFSSNMSEADILHFHTHVNEIGVKQHLSLEPEIDATAVNDKFQRVSRSLNPFFHLRRERRFDTYNLQDAFATQIRAKLVVMMGCRSGRQHISASDDALGLISAFFAAGASSIVASLWQFETSDASSFSSHFYRETFMQQKDNALIDVAGSFRRSVMEMRACQKVVCRKRKSLEQRLGCHVLEEQASPYHWAGFVLWGSWVMRGVGAEGGVSEEVREEVLGAGVGIGKGKGKEKDNVDADVSQARPAGGDESFNDCKTQ